MVYNWKTLWMDRRKFQQRLVLFSLILAISAWILVSIAVGQSLPERANAPVNVGDVVRFQWWAIAGLLGLVGTLIGVIFLYMLNNTRSDVRDLWDKKLNKEEHSTMDHSVLCPICRNHASGNK